jgi:hypothetical protein
MKSYQFTLPDELAAFVDRVRVEKNWDSVDHLFAYNLLQVESEVMFDNPAELDVLRKAVQFGIDQADRGKLIEGTIVLQHLHDTFTTAKSRQR